ncbi:MAG: hypothetical protein FJ304_00285 [Planctomycetes bacterium]|nr:hypothetical protein [Planctomycetota bacterium]
MNDAGRIAVPGRALGLRAFVFGGLTVAQAGFALVAIRAVRRGPRDLASAAAVCSLVGPPLLLALARPESTYLICKLLWRLTPFVAVRSACVLHAILRRAAALCAFGLLPCCFALHHYREHCNYLQPDSVRAGPATRRNGDDLQTVCADLRAWPGGDVVLALDDDPDPMVASAALYYHGRHHRVQLVNPGCLWISNIVAPCPAWPIDSDPVPDGAVVVQRAQKTRLTGPQVEVVARHGSYDLVRIAPLASVSACGRRP